MAVLGLVLATTLTTAWSASHPTLPGENKIAAHVVEQSDLQGKPLPTAAVQNPASQTCPAPTWHGTAVNFVATPTEAARKARKDNKLTFLLHISGNFEDAEFT
jgi:hypothetical protein